jgi:predicted pyridoxine 5'-phosphate oxidase superfamily flavin-nucleotide-binding protein
MGRAFAKVMFSAAAKRYQERYGSAESYERVARQGPAGDSLGPMEREFIGRRDSFYIATMTADGWPYVQHRGGPKGFLRVLDDRTLAFADFAGNAQYITVGDLETNDRVALFLMDYPNQARLKVIGHAKAVAGDAELEGKVRVAITDEAPHPSERQPTPLQPVILSEAAHKVSSAVEGPAIPVTATQTSAPFSHAIEPDLDVPLTLAAVHAAAAEVSWQADQEPQPCHEFHVSAEARSARPRSRSTTAHSATAATSPTCSVPLRIGPKSSRPSSPTWTPC